MEILAPAGSYKSLVAAAACGADAVYLGTSKLNARRAAQNFEGEQLSGAVAYCHARGVKVYLTLNTVVMGDELPILVKALEEASSLGVDGVIIQDLAVLALVRAVCPQMPIIGSTQMAITGPDGAAAAKELGFSRVVLARELNLGEIRAITSSCDIQTEVFVHGSMCVGVSGQCYLSAVIGGRSGNRGLCAQPCRLPFSSGGRDEAGLSLKDLSLIDRIAALKSVGVSSLKIEGRMKRPEYVAAATTACRKALAGETPDMDELAALFSRSGFTKGYFEGCPGADIFGVRLKEDVTAASPALFAKYAALYEKETGRVTTDFKLDISEFAHPSLQVSDREGGIFTATLPEYPQPAKTSPTTTQKAVAALSKTGGTIFTPGKIECNIAPEIYLGVSHINTLRRTALDGLAEIRGRARPLNFDRHAAARVIDIPDEREKPVCPKLYIRLERAGQLAGVPQNGAWLVSLPMSELESISDNALGQTLAVELPKYEFGGWDDLPGRLAALRKRGIAHAVAGSLAALRLGSVGGFECIGDFTLNITNTPALGEYDRLGAAAATLSFELRLSEAKKIAGSLPRGVIAYGFLPVMQLRVCPVRTRRGCEGCNYPTLRDRKGKRFFLSCRDGTVVLHNYLPLWMGDKQPELEGFDFITLYFTRESPGQILRLIKDFENGGYPGGEYTRGLYYRGVE